MIFWTIFKKDSNILVLVCNMIIFGIVSTIVQTILFCWKFQVLCNFLLQRLSEGTQLGNYLTSREEDRNLTFKQPVTNSSSLIWPSPSISNSWEKWKSSLFEIDLVITQPAKFQKKAVWRSVFRTRRHIECRLNKNSLLQCYFLSFLPAG